MVVAKPWTDHLDGLRNGSGGYCFTRLSTATAFWQPRRPCQARPWPPSAPPPTAASSLRRPPQREWPRGRRRGRVKCRFRAWVWAPSAVGRQRAGACNPSVCRHPRSPLDGVLCLRPQLSERGAYPRTRRECPPLEPQALGGPRARLRRQRAVLETDGPGVVAADWGVARVAGGRRVARLHVAVHPRALGRCLRAESGRSSGAELSPVRTRAGRIKPKYMTSRFIRPYFSLSRVSLFLSLFSHRSPFSHFSLRFLHSGATTTARSRAPLGGGV